MGPRSILNKLKWTNQDFSKVEIWYIHRGAPDDTRIVNGKDIIEIGKAFLELSNEHGEGVGIPYHRIFRIVADGKVVYDKHQRGVEKE